MRKLLEVKLIIFMCLIILIAKLHNSDQLHWFHFHMGNYETYPIASETLILLQTH